MRSISGFLGNLAMKGFGLLPIQNKIVFQSFSGKYYNDNPKAIYEAMISKHTEFKYVWLMNNEKYAIPGATVVKKNSWKALYHMATAKIWIANSRLREWIFKRKHQYYVQTWHGGFAVKKVEADVADKMPESYIRNAKHDSKIADLFISGSSWRTNNYRSSFWYNGDILECGLPRSDIFYKDTQSKCEKVKKFYNLQNERIVLYAPTFRVSHKLDAYDMDYRRLLNKLQETWKGSWKLLIRLHPSIASLQNKIKYDEDILNGSAYSDINDLIIASDLLITDYSGCMFDAIESGKRCILYASDLDTYNEDRGTYFKIQGLPFEIAQNNQSLMEIISNFDESSYNEKIATFKNELGFICRPNSSEIASEYIIEKAYSK